MDKQKKQCLGVDVESIKDVACLNNRAVSDIDNAKRSMRKLSEKLDLVKDFSFFRHKHKKNKDFKKRLHRLERKTNALSSKVFIKNHSLLEYTPKVDKKREKDIKRKIRHVKNKERRNRSSFIIKPKQRRERTELPFKALLSR